MEKVNGMDEGYTEVSYNGEHYIIYNMILNSNWRCVTVRNATSTFKPLFVILITTIAVVILVIIVLSYIMYNYTKRFYIADNLNKQLSAIANTFYSLYDIDILNDKFSLIKSSLSTETADPDQQTEHAREALIRAANQLTSEISRPEVLKFIDFDTLNHRLKKQDTIAEEFLSSNNVWCRARFVVAKRNGDGSINHVLWIVEGIDEEKRRRDQLIDMSEKAFAESKAKSDFLSNMSHEIRTPINAVLGMNEMILRESNEANIIGYSESIKSSGNTLLSLINDILDFSKIESGKIDLVPVDYDLSSVINDLAVMIRSRADEKGLRLCFDINPDTPKRLNGDEVRIKQIITNILTNAVKYTEKGTVTLGVDYQDIDTEPDSVFINVEVKDTGIGIKKEDMDKLFVEYERIEVKRNRHIEGTGLGLSITKGLLELMGSSLKAESIYGLGSKFSFSLKQKVIAREPLGDYEADFEEMRKKHDRYKEKFLAPDAEILVVDDNQMNLSVFKNLLKKTRIKIDTAESGNEGLALMKKKKYDVIFLDHMMPRKDGIETLQDLKSDKGNPNTETPVICLTANAIAGIRDQYLAAGFDDYISKPVDPEKLEEMLIYYLPDGKVSMEDV
ncbi:MAG: response regulator [Lachnospiraceae bacterium]|nr:response regulator [Lachnospiraceae bacterium]